MALAKITQGVMWYNQLLIDKPISTSMISAAGIFGLGDAICQKVFPKVKPGHEDEDVPFDYNRFKSAVIVGTLFRCPSALFTYRIVNPWYIKSFFPWLVPWFTKNYTPTKKVILAVLFDVYVYKWFSTWMYMSATHMVEKSKGDWSMTWEFVKENYWL